MNANFENSRQIQVATILTRCPFCNCRARLMRQDVEPANYGVCCYGCRAGLSAGFKKPEAALAAWCVRKGSISAAGGRATNGISTLKKQWACRRNLRRAREKKKLKQIIAHGDELYCQLKHYREIELAAIREAREEDNRRDCHLNIGMFIQPLKIGKVLRCPDTGE